MSAADTVRNAQTNATSEAINALRGAGAHVEHAVARTLDPFGLSTAQFAVLQVMGEAAEEKLGCSEIGRRLAARAPDVTRLLDRLESVGLVARERDQKDRRVVHTHITTVGLEVLEKAVPMVHMAEDQALVNLSIADRQHLAALLNGVQRNCPGN